MDWEVELAVVIGKRGKYIKVRERGPAILALRSGWHLPAPDTALSLTHHHLWLLGIKALRPFVIGLGVTMS